VDTLKKRKEREKKRIRPEKRTGHGQSVCSIQVAMNIGTGTKKDK